MKTLDFANLLNKIDPTGNATWTIEGFSIIGIKKEEITEPECISWMEIDENGEPVKAIFETPEYILDIITGDPIDYMAVNPDVIIPTDTSKLHPDCLEDINNDIEWVKGISEAGKQRKLKLSFVDWAIDFLKIDYSRYKLEEFYDEHLKNLDYSNTNPEIVWEKHVKNVEKEIITTNKIKNLIFSEV